MNILFIGDIFGKTGIRAILKQLDHIIDEYNIDFVIANGENTTKCRGLSYADYSNLKKLGINFFTLGNHTWRQNDYPEVLKQDDVIRPLNINENSDLANYGLGTRVVEVKNKKIRITNLLGSSIYNRYSEQNFINPFKCLESLLSEIQHEDSIHIVDFHSETTSEKNCAIRSFKGRVQAILGTHTHVQTNDARIIENTAYITDIGMTGPAEGIIGAKEDTLIEMFYDDRQFFKLSEASGKYQLSFIVIEFDDSTNNPISIKNLIIYE